MTQLELEIKTLEGKLAWLKANPTEDKYDGWNNLADCKCKRSEEIYIRLMQLRG